MENPTFFLCKKHTKSDSDTYYDVHVCSKEVSFKICYFHWDCEYMSSTMRICNEPTCNKGTLSRFDLDDYDDFGELKVKNESETLWWCNSHYKNHEHEQMSVELKNAKELWS